MLIHKLFPAVKAAVGYYLLLICLWLFFGWLAHWG